MVCFGGEKGRRRIYDDPGNEGGELLWGKCCVVLTSSMGYEDCSYKDHYSSVLCIASSCKVILIVDTSLLQGSEVIDIRDFSLAL